MIPKLITMKDAREHLRMDHDLDDVQINQKRIQASAIVLDYLKKDVSDTAFDWVDENGDPDPERLPYQAAAATLLVLGALYENRDGDVWRSPQHLSQSVIDLLARLRDPAMA